MAEADDRLIDAYERGFNSGYERGVATARTMGVLLHPVEVLGLSIRSSRICELLGCITLADLTALNEEGLLRKRNVGITTVRELREKLALFGLKMTGKSVSE